MVQKKAWVVAVNMGYGHQRTAYPLQQFAQGGKIIQANDYEGIPKKDRKIWKASRHFYEFISRLKRIPLIGGLAFSAFDTLQKIQSFYPKRDLSKPTFLLKRTYALLRKEWGRDLIARLKQEPIPLVTTFLIPAFMAEEFDYPGTIFCVVADADIARPWAPLHPSESSIRYCCPTKRVVERLQMYGVKRENIILTGFPLPTENIGTEAMEILKDDLRYRLINLDPQKKHYEHYRLRIENLGPLPSELNHPLTVLFSIGGAGAQKEIVAHYMRSLAEKIQQGAIRVILAAGIRREVRDSFLAMVKNLGLQKSMPEYIEIVFASEIHAYFKAFNQVLRKTDILWTKPSELSFYCGLGIPILMAPPIGSQEDFNQAWLLKIGAGIMQEDPRYAHQWIFDWQAAGIFAEAALHGLEEAEQLGTYAIQKMCLREDMIMP